MKMNPRSTRSSMKAACSSQKGCSRVPFDESRLGPGEDATMNLCFMTRSGEIYCTQINVAGRLCQTPGLRRERRRLPTRRAEDCPPYLPDSALQPLKHHRQLSHE